MRKTFLVAFIFTLLSNSVSAAEENDYYGKKSFSYTRGYPSDGLIHLVVGDYSAVMFDQTLPSQNRSVIPICDENKTIIPCIFSFSGRINDASDWTPLIPGIQLHRKPFNPPQPNQETTPVGSHFPRIWQAPSFLSTEAGASYILSVTTSGDQFQISINPININSSLYENPQATCPWVFQEIECPQRYNFPKDSQFKVELFLNKSMSKNKSWLNGRISDPAITINQMSDLTKFSISGSPMQTQIAIAKFKREEFEASYPNILLPGSIGWNVDSKYAEDIYNKNIDVIEEKSAGQVDAWTVTTQINSNQSCFNDTSSGFGGMLTTNATAYRPSPPDWDASVKSLNYRVSAPHFKPNGEKFLGEYRVILKQSIAECLWGSALENAKAEISITNIDGTTQVSTTTTRIQNGFLYLSATGFHYSQSKISVKMINSTQKKIFIQCTKGKLKKVISSTKPKCPTGYKLKTN